MELVGALLLSVLGIAIVAGLMSMSTDATIDELTARLHDDEAGEQPEPDLAAIHRESLAEFAAHGGDVEDPDPVFEADDEDEDEDAYAEDEVADATFGADDLDDEPWFAPRDEPGEMVSTQPFDVPDSFYAAERFASQDAAATAPDLDLPMTAVYAGDFTPIVAGMLRANGIDAIVVKRSSHPAIRNEVRVPISDADDARRLIAEADSSE